MLAMRPSGAVAPFKSSAVKQTRIAKCVVPTSCNVLSGMSLGSPSSEPVSSAPVSCMKVTMMRHGNRVKHLGRPADQRKALIRSLVTQLIQYGSIRTTKIKAKAIRKYVDHMITLAKDGSLHARRQALGFVYDKDLVKALFTGVPDRYANRQGGYTRIRTESSLRRGDAAEMAIIELVE